MARSYSSTTIPGPRPWTIRAIAPTLLVVLVAAGCGGSDDVTETFADPIDLVTSSTVSAETELEDEIVSALSKEARVPRPESQLRCVAQAAIDAVGVDALIEAGAPAPGTFDGTLLDAEAQAALIDEVIACADIGSLLLDAETAGVAIAPESVSCIVDEVERSGLAERVIRAAVATNPDQALADHLPEIAETLNSCLNLQEIAQIFESFGLVPFLPGG